MPPPQISVQLSALALQCEFSKKPQSKNYLITHLKISYPLAAELGDYDPVLHTPAFVSEFRFVPVQTEELEMEIVECYRHMRYVDTYLKSNTGKLYFE